MIRTELLRPIHELLAQHARERADQAAFLDDRRTLTYGELFCRSKRLAAHLAEIGVERGDRVAVLMGNRVETAEAYLAVPRSGGIAVCLNPRSTRAEVEYALRDSGARILVTDNADLANELVARCSVTRVVCLTTGQPTSVSTTESTTTRWYDYETVAVREGSIPAPDVLDLDEVAYMLYTSGTTGNPKGVLLTQRGLLWIVAACWAPILGLKAEDRILCALPLYHSYALNLCVLGVVAVGATERIMPGFSVIEARRHLTTGGFTVLPGVPTMFINLTRMALRNPISHALRVAVSAGAILASSAHRDFEQAHGVPLLDGYGITETSTMITLNWPTGARPSGSCGLPIPGISVRLVDPTNGCDVPTGREGEVWVRSPGVMKGYHNRLAETAKAMAGGWYHTGDLAHADASGYLTITGRTTELIIRGGENISPAEVEEVLLTARGVRDAAVVGRFDDRVGEVPVAFVVGEDLELPELVAHCREYLAWFKVPTDIHITSEIPRTGSGKIMRYRLADSLGEGNHPPSTRSITEPQA